LAKEDYTVVQQLEDQHEELIGRAFGPRSRHGNSSSPMARE
jgi:hypothetical protein